MSGTPTTTLNLDALRDDSGDDRRQAFETFLCRTLDRYLDIPPAHRIAPDRPLYTQGIDSLTALAFQRTLESALNIPVPAHHLLREQSVGELAATLSELVDRT